MKLFSQFYLTPNSQAAILVLAGVYGLLAIGIFPVALELAVEATYPAEETLSATLIYACGHLQGIVMTLLIPALSTPTTALEGEQCSVGDSEIIPRDYTCKFILRQICW